MNTLNLVVWFEPMEICEVEDTTKIDVFGLRLLKIEFDLFFYLDSILEVLWILLIYS